MEKKYYNPWGKMNLVTLVAPQSEKRAYFQCAGDAKAGVGEEQELPRPCGQQTA